MEDVLALDVLKYSFRPTPRVAWRRSDNRMPERVKPMSYGQELVISNVEFDDAGRYHCDGENPAGNSTKEIILIVECERPFILPLVPHRTFAWF